MLFQSQSKTAPLSARFVFLLLLLGVSVVNAAPIVDRPQEPDKAAACFASLQAEGIKFERAAQPVTKNAACAIDAPVKLISAPQAGGKSEIVFPDKPLLACAFAGQFADFVKQVANPLALSALGTPIKSIETGPGHECRFRNRATSGKMSEHGRGLALDMRSLTLADDRRLIVGTDKDKRFLETLAKAACGFFATVLGPGADAMHKDHLHFDAELRISRMGGHFCQP